MNTCKKCGLSFPLLILVDGKKRNISNRRLCLDCKPFRLGTPETMTRRGGYQNCVLCDKSYHQRLCPSCRTKIRRHRAKREAVRILGGVCVRCGWSGPVSGFQFHHTDPKNKDFTVGNGSHKSWTLILKEIMKCKLMCATCHAILHSDREDPAFLAEVDRYKGTDLAG